MLWRGNGDETRCAWWVEEEGGGAGRCFLEAVFGSWLHGCVLRRGDKIGERAAGAKPCPLKHSTARGPRGILQPTLLLVSRCLVIVIYIMSSNVSIFRVKPSLSNASLNATNWPCSAQTFHYPPRAPMLPKQPSYPKPSTCHSTHGESVPSAAPNSAVI